MGVAEESQRWEESGCFEEDFYLEDWTEEREKDGMSVFWVSVAGFVR